MITYVAFAIQHSRNTQSAWAFLAWCCNVAKLCMKVLTTVQISAALKGSLMRHIRDVLF